MPDIVDRRILGAFVCIDSITSNSVVNRLSVMSVPEWPVRPNRSGVYVVFDGPNMGSLTGEFIPSGGWPAKPSTFEVTLYDPGRLYLPRRVNISAPLSVPAIAPPPAGSTSNPAAQAALAQTGTVFHPQPVAVYRAPSAPTGPNWAVIRASVTRFGTTPPQGLPWAVLQVVRTSDNTVLATGQTDSNGEALLAAVGLTIETNTTGTGPVTLSTVAVTVNVYFDPANANAPVGWILNPDDILSKLPDPSFSSASQAVQLGSGQELFMNFVLTV